MNRRKITGLVLVGVVALSLVLLLGTATATPPSGLTAEPVASALLSEIVRAKFKAADDSFGQDTAVKRIVMVKYTLQPGGTFGWHQHGGPVWAVVTAGTLTIYRGDDPTCTPQYYSAGNGFLDPGNDTHMGINETNAPVEVYTTFMLPEGGPPRIDAADPGICN